VNRLSRRSLIQIAAGAPLMAQAVPAGTGFGLQELGKLPVRASSAIAASPLSIGFECLDRRLFDPEKTYPFMAKLGAKWARVQTGWSRCETVKGEFDFRWLDSIVDSLLHIGIQPWFNLGYGNQLYSPDSPLESAVGWVPIRTPEQKQAWTRFTERISAHFRGRVRHWEIWNEPNITVFWKPTQPSAAGYAELVKLTAPAIRNANPDAVIVGGGLTGTYPDVLEYLDTALKNGIAEHVDRISYHRYRSNPDRGYAAEVRAARALLDLYKPGLALWQGESGAPSQPGGIGAMGTLKWTEERQAKYLLRRTIVDASLSLELSSYFEIVDLVGYREGTDQAGKTAYFGLLRPDYTPKPAYFAYQRLCSVFDAETRAVDLSVQFDNLQPSELAPAAISCATFHRRGCPIFAYWYSADLMTDPPPGRVSATLWPGPQSRMPDPVLVDPLTGAVLKPQRPQFTGGVWKMPLPVTDYPLIVTDRTIAT
jgi:hypothetical protein